MISRLRTVAPVVLVAVVGLAGCGGDGGSASGATVPADADLVVTALEGIKWDAAEYSTTAGTVTVALVNASSQPHNLHFIAEDGTENPTVLEIPSKGAVAVDEVTLEAGTYTLICTIPGHGNMKAPLVVS